jgi:hypothetical protein
MLRACTPLAVEPDEGDTLNQPVPDEAIALNGTTEPLELVIVTDVVFPVVSSKMIELGWAFRLGVALMMRETGICSDGSPEELTSTVPT